jgi:enterochelin esterase-like enzyme
VPVHNFRPPRGRIEQFVVRSRVLRENRLGDPSERTVAVYLPDGYDAGTEPWPLFVALAGFTSGGLKMLSWQSFGESVPQRIDRLIEQGEIGPVVTVFPDGFTSLGGNQYINSSVVGRWEDFLLDEMLPAVEQRYRVRRDAGGRAVFGRSSGGYGALIQGLRHGDRWGAVACHSGDIDFDLVYRPDLPKALDTLARYEGRVDRFVEKIRQEPKIGGQDFYALMLLAMSATYDPDPSAPWGVRLPVDPHTCRLIEERWDQWLRHDPLRLIEQPACRESLEQLGLLFLDCGYRDQYALHYGARSLVARLERYGIDHRYEEFDDDHSGIDYRLDRSFPLLYEAVAKVR